MKFKKWLILPMAISFIGLIASCGDDDTAPVCGNGIIETGEQCDDANDIDADECSNTCMLPADTCGDGVVDEGEQCDDGNAVAGDGCENDCTVTPGDCGDGNLDAGEECDDGNFITGDECTNDCKIAVCGDGILNVGVEECDDGNDIETDGCLNNCMIDPLLNCGDGVVDPSEECDDGNQDNTDACTNVCENAVCGDGITQVGVEECDDGDDDNGDGCENNCTLTPIAETKTFNGPAIAIVDNAYDGGLATMACVNLMVQEDGAGFNTFVDASVRLGIEHKALGNLVIKLQAPSGDTLTLLNRAGFAEAADDGAGDEPGTSFGLVATSKITFIETQGKTSAEEMGATLMNVGDAACLDDGICEYFPSPGAATPGLFSDLVGQSTIGNWVVCVGDASSDLEGSLESVELFLTKKLSI